ncbi:OLC1v1008307C1 [Oldenlandia corymbosa var. corymbosa]|uniref:OLC1v1008307C1 n=1 Tax=Oldenlandia corymbosa var. corymbosa TaxID=529605 RepID=A0AAV1DLS8_OLDCO|nr:OLC1v1008307C1 [Oldenlandia corymbosa var. corymbosa]
MTRPITEAAITDLYNTISPKTWCIADLGCSSGPNTFMVVFDLIKTVDKRRKTLGLESPEYQIFLNDLPSNDFNTIFKSVPEFQEKLRNEMEAGFGQCFVTGVPEMEEANKGNIHITNSSPQSVISVYVKPFEKDFSAFLRCRSEEMVTGGRMVLALQGRKSENPCSTEGSYFWELLAMALREMVSEGLVEEEKLDSFNIPDYKPSPGQVRSLVELEGSFKIDRLETSEIHWNAYEGEILEDGKFRDGGNNLAKCVRAIAEPLLVRHFGEEIIEEVFSRYKGILNDYMSKEQSPLFVNVTASLIKMN